ncbi:MAG TPA: kynureninase [Pyrinomonadaceae bacterium]|jgi:kynureninase|nr:kynureninase [Pyrinomonadaceae bacterium]
MISPERQYKNDEAFAAEMDAADPLRHFRDKFYLPRQQNGEEYVYFTGNSLGLQPKTARGYVEQELKDWEELGVKAHLEAKTPWLPYHEFLTEQMAAVIGALPVETVVMNSLTVNLHLLLVSFYRPTETRRKIVIERGAFPSDQYAVASQIKFHTMNAPADESLLIELTPREGEATLRTEDILQTIEKEGDSIALILLGGVNYYTGQAFEMQRIAEAGHKVGAIVGFDLAHAAGNLELKMHDWDVDFAAWCSYKYLNAGPGAVAGAFVHERHAKDFDLPRFAGWWGHDKETRFLMGPNFKPMAGAEGWQISNPPILQMAALRASLEVFAEAGMPALVEKSRKLTGYLEYLLDEIGDERISVITPRDPAQRGCQLSIRVKDADKTLYQKISEGGVLADWREPDVIRVAPAPLYNSFADVFKFAEILKSELERGL